MREGDTILLSGGFDPVHPGHIAMFNEAAKYGFVTVALNSDRWLTRKKGKPFMTFDDRMCVVKNMWSVGEVISVDDTDGTVCEAIHRVRPTFFGNGGDRNADTTPSAELLLCAKLGIKPLFGLANTPHHSSDIINNGIIVERKWGTYQVLYEGHGFKVKLLTVNGQSETSMQRHRMRAEIWAYPDGEGKIVRRNEWHQIQNPLASVLHMIEVQVGSSLEETDIERYPTSK